MGEREDRLHAAVTAYAHAHGIHPDPESVIRRALWELDQTVGLVTGCYSPTSNGSSAGYWLGLSYQVNRPSLSSMIEALAHLAPRDCRFWELLEEYNNRCTKLGIRGTDNETKTHLVTTYLRDGPEAGVAAIEKEYALLLL